MPTTPNEQKPLYIYLAYLGLIPFVGLTLLLVKSIHILPLIGSTLTAFLLYALLISVFMSGAHWGQQLHPNSQWNIFLPITSNINTVVLWISYLCLDKHTVLTILSISYIGLLIIDKVLYHYDAIKSDYYLARKIITTIVLFCLIDVGVYS